MERREKRLRFPITLLPLKNVNTYKPYFSLNLHYNICTCSVQCCEREMNWKIQQSSIKYAGSLGWWDNGLIYQVANVPNILSALSPSQKPTVFFQSIKILLGLSDAWLMRQTSQRPNSLYWRLSDLISDTLFNTVASSFHILQAKQ